MKTLASQWGIVLALTVAALIGIQASFGHYNSLQTASDAAAFRHTLDGHTVRAIAATCCDLVFAAGYGLLGVIALRSLNGRGALAAIGGVLVVGSALFDEVENTFLIVNIAAHRTLTNGMVNAMQVPGTLKWIGSPVFGVLLVLLGVRAVRERRS